MDLAKADFRKILAELYHHACLDEQCDMRETVDLLEGLQETFLSNPTMLAWSSLKLDSGRFGKSPYFELVRSFRNQVFSNYVKKGISEIHRLEQLDKQKAFELWLEIFTDAFLTFEWDVLLPLFESTFLFPESEERKTRTYQSAARLVMNHQWADAIDVFMELAENEQIPKSKRVHFATYVSEILVYHYGRTETAQSWLEKAKDLVPNHVLVERLHGEIELFNKNLGNARNHLLNALSIDSNHVDAYLFLGDTFLEEQAYDIAKQWYEDASSIHFLNASPYKNLLKLYGTAKWIDQKTPELEAIISKLEEIEVRSSSNIELYHAYREAAFSFHLQGNLERAKDYYLKAIALRPDLYVAKIDLGYILSYAGQLDEAEKWFGEAAEPSSQKSFDALWAQGWLAEQRKEFKLAASQYSQCLGLRPFGDDRIHNVVGLQYFKLEDYATAIEQFSKAIAVYPGHMVYFDNIKDAADRTGLPEHLQIYHDLLTKHFPESHLYWNNAGVFYFQQQNDEKAISCYDQAIRLETGNGLYFKNRALAWQNLGKYENAEADLLQALALGTRPEYLATLEIPKKELKSAATYGRDAELLNYIGLSKYFQNKNEEAIEFYSEAINLDAGKVAFFENRALAKERLQDYPGAIKDYKLALSFGEDPFLNNAIGRLEYWQHNLNEAIDYYTKAIEGDPNLALYLENRALAYEGLGNVALAEKDYEAAIGLGPNIYGLNSYGILKTKLNEHEKAIELFSRAIDIDASFAILFENRAVSRKQIMEFDAAFDDIQKAIKLEPTAERYNMLGLLHYLMFDYIQAIEAYTKAIEINPNLAVIWENRALAHEVSANYQEAIKDYLQSLQLNPDPYVFNKLGEIYRTLGNTAEAKSCFVKATELDPSDPIYRQNLEDCS